VPIDNSVQTALREILATTAAELQPIGAWRAYEVAEKYAATDPLRTPLVRPDMAIIKALYDEEGWATATDVLRKAAAVSHYFGVFRDGAGRKLVGGRRASAFKGTLKHQLMRFMDDTLRMIGQDVLRLERTFDFLVTHQHIYTLHPTGFEKIARIETAVATEARSRAVALGTQMAFVDFADLAAYVEKHPRAARLAVALSHRGDLDVITRAKLKKAAIETGVALIRKGTKLAPAKGSELGFLELLDDRRYAADLRTGGKTSYVANSRTKLLPTA
jgi:hypothetical protein